MQICYPASYNFVYHISASATLSCESFGFWTNEHFYFRVMHWLNTSVLKKLEMQ